MPEDEHDPKEPILDEQRGLPHRDTKKINSRSASYHFSMNAGEGSEIVATGEIQPDGLDDHAWGSPSQVKSMR